MIDYSILYNVIYNLILSFKNSLFVKTTFLISNTLFYIILFITIPLSIMYLYIALNSVFHKKRQEEIINEDYFPFVTIQIPTYNELAAINCAKKCLEFDYPKDKYEILIGDDSNKPEVSEKLREFADKHKLIRIIKREKNIGFKPGNLNNMLKYSKGEFIAIFDSDYLPSQDFLKRAVIPFKDDEKVAGVQARWDFTNPHQNIITTLATTVLITTHHIIIPFISRKGVSHLCGSAEIVRKSTLKKLGGWISGSLTEDIEYTLRALKNDYKIIYLENLKCKGELPHTTKDYYKQQMRWAYGVIKAYVHHGKEILFNKNISIQKKYAMSLMGSGYLTTLLLQVLIIMGIIASITHPGMDINLPVFLSQLIRNIFLTSGLMIAGIVGLFMTKKIKHVFSVILSSFTIGFGVIYYVNKGIFKALLNKPMQWHMLNKIGNKSDLTE